MGDLRPLGSEKLQGQSKLQRILELATWNEKKPNPVNEVSSTEYKITLADGNEYQIVKEKLGYIVKKSVNEGTEYIEPMQNRRYLQSYSQALKKLNLMAKEYNTIYENEEGTSLFSEQKKFVLKTPKSEKKNDISEPTSELPAPMPSEEPTLPPPPPSEPMDEPSMPELPSDISSDEMGMDTPEDTEPTDEIDTEIDVEETEPTSDVSFKLIQKLVGKLGQKIRQYSEQNEISDKDAKYIINSVLSAIDLTKIGDETKKK